MTHAENKPKVPLPAKDTEEAPLAAVVVADEDSLVPLAVEAAVAVPVPVALASDPELAVEADDDPVAVEEGDTLEERTTPSHERSYKGVVLRLLSLALVPTTPKLGFGVVGEASCKTYHQVLTTPKADAHPT